MSLSQTKLWVAGAVVVCLAATLASWFLLISPTRAETAELRDQALSTQSANAQLALEIQELEAQFADLPQRQAELAAIKSAMPETAALPTLVRDLEALATASGVTLMSVTPGTAALVAAPVATVPPASTEGGAQGAAESEPVPAAPAAAGDTLAAVPVDVIVVGNFYNAGAFLESVQTGLSRDYLVRGLNVVAETKTADAASGKPAVKNGDVTMTITGSVFVLKPAVQVAAITPAPTATN